ncbi:TlpA family protein disulfide reductase [Robertkochia flava]|uniref:TlpA family protein disulfide reductase n=1 Tax=Robertkochia flava TaxID=3447986 RepID=UPI001CCD497B|nr:TlpA disulfide reductase family protein [Robertkochia marina]
MKQISILTLLTFTSCSEDPQGILDQARQKISTSENFNYELVALNPNPIGEIDTVKTSSFFSKNPESVIGYDFIIKNKFYDNIYQEGEFKSVNHRDESVEFFPEKNPDLVKSAFINSYSIRNSPLILLEKTDWIYVKDTLIDGNDLLDFYRIENDKVVEGNKVYTEQHIFINTDLKLLERWERRNYFKGSLSQRLVCSYSDYELGPGKEKPAYTPPSDYKSVFYGKNKERTLLEAGQEAPLFEEVDLQDNSLSLKEYRGKKILLNFSSTGCGHCHQAIKFMNQNDFELPANMETFYIAPFDKQKDLVAYFDKVKVSFPVVPNAEKIGEAYGVSSTPTFILINEQGIIDSVVVGFDKAFLESL